MTKEIIEMEYNEDLEYTILGVDADDEGSFNITLHMPSDGLVVRYENLEVVNDDVDVDEEDDDSTFIVNYTAKVSTIDGEDPGQSEEELQEKSMELVNKFILDSLYAAVEERELEEDDTEEE